MARKTIVQRAPLSSERPEQSEEQAQPSNATKEQGPEEQIAHSGSNPTPLAPNLAEPFEEEVSSFKA